MIVILTYYTDGSGKPEIKFFPVVPEQAAQVASELMAAIRDGKQTEVYEIEDLSLEPVELTAKD